MKKITAILLLLISMNSMAYWPSGIETSSDLFQRYRALLKIKLSELSSNFISKMDENKITFYKDSNKINIEAVLIKKSSSNDLTNEYKETFIFFNGKNELVYKEVFKSKGINTKKILLKDYLIKSIDFSLSKTGINKKYFFYDQSDSVQIQFSIERRNDHILLKHQLKGETAFTWNIFEDKDKFNIEYNYYPIKSIDYILPHYSCSRQKTRSSSIYSNKVIDYKTSFIRKMMDSDRNQLSRVKYLRFYTWNTDTERLSKTNCILKGVVFSQMPTTKQVQSAGANQKLINELQLYLNKLTIGDVNFVVKQLKILKNDVENGKITDNRR